MESTKKNPLLKVSEVQIRYSPKFIPIERPKIDGSKTAERILRQNWNANHIQAFEEFKVMLLNRANCVLGIFQVSRGGVAGTVADPKLIFAVAIKTLASGIILAHNHPSGNLSASQADVDLTKKIKEGAKLFDIQLLDHVILTSKSYFSFADEGLL